MASCAHVPPPKSQDSDLHRPMAWFPGASALRALSRAHVRVWGLGAAGRGCHTPAWPGSAHVVRSSYVNRALCGISTSADPCCSLQRLPRTNAQMCPIYGKKGVHEHRGVIAHGCLLKKCAARRGRSRLDFEMALQAAQVRADIHRVSDLSCRWGRLVHLSLLEPDAGNAEGVASSGRPSPSNRRPAH